MKMLNKLQSGTEELRENFDKESIIKNQQA